MAIFPPRFLLGSTYKKTAGTPRSRIAPDAAPGLEISLQRQGMRRPIRRPVTLRRPAAVIRNGTIKAQAHCPRATADRLSANGAGRHDEPQRDRAPVSHGAILTGTALQGHKPRPTTVNGARADASALGGSAKLARYRIIHHPGTILHGFGVRSGLRGDPVRDVIGMRRSGCDRHEHNHARQYCGTRPDLHGPVS
jgi:hypothetical protein